MEQGEKKSTNVKTILLSVTFVALAVVAIIYFFNINEAPAPEPKEVTVAGLEIEDGVHKATGLIADAGLELVIGNCTNCHSAKLITQNKATREGWESMIRWMQKTQKLWPLGTSEPVILDYLSKNYGPEDKGRRAPLTNIEWYELE
ncbi:MAG: hypothetical protein JXQ96_11220 [Cyclobacteriaceae bacterium]